MKLPWYIKTDYSKSKNGITNDAEGHLFWNVKISKLWIYSQYVKMFFMVGFELIMKKLKSWQTE